MGKNNVSRQPKPRIGLHLDTSKVSPNNRGSHLYLRVRIDRKYSFFATHIFIQADNWDGRSKRVKSRKGFGKVDAIEKGIRAAIQRMDDCIEKLQTSGQRLSESELKELWGFTDNMCLTEFFELVIAERSGHLTTASINSYKCVLSKIRLFQPKVRLEQVDGPWLESFQDFLLRWGSKFTDEKGKGYPMSARSVKTYFAILKKALRLAKKKRLIDFDPFEDFERKYKIRPKQIEFLSEGEINRLYFSYLQQDLLKPNRFPGQEKLLQRNGQLYHDVLQLYLVSVFSGLRFSDAVRIDDCIKGGYIYITMKKTSQPIRIRIGERLRSILNHNPQTQSYLNRKHKDGSRTNLHLRKLLPVLGINRYLTFHSARHTFATTLLTHGTDLKTVSKLLGHSSVAMTEIYTHITDKRKDEAILKMDQLGGEPMEKADPVWEVLRLMESNPDIPRPSEEWFAKLRKRLG